MNKNCKLCGSNLIWESPHIPGYFHEIEDWPICHACMSDHCVSTNCLMCDYGEYPDCGFAVMKEQCMRGDNYDDAGNHDD